MFFIKECDTEAKITYEASRTEYDKKMCYGGLKFEQFVTTDKLGTAPDTSVPVDNNNEFIGMFRATLGGKSSARVRLLYGAETDAILPTSGEFVEIKVIIDFLLSIVYDIIHIEMFRRSRIALDMEISFI